MWAFYGKVCALFEATSIINKQFILSSSSVKQLNCKTISCELEQLYVLCSISGCCFTTQFSPPNKNRQMHMQCNLFFLRFAFEEEKLKKFVFIAELLLCEGFLFRELKFDTTREWWVTELEEAAGYRLTANENVVWWNMDSGEHRIAWAFTWQQWHVKVYQFLN